VSIELELEWAGYGIVRCRWRLEGQTTWVVCAFASDQRQTFFDFLDAVLVAVEGELRQHAA
jgi:hypothetical protein